MLEILELILRNISKIVYGINHMLGNKRSRTFSQVYVSSPSQILDLVPCIPKLNSLNAWWCLEGREGERELNSLFLSPDHAVGCYRILQWYCIYSESPTLSLQAGALSCVCHQIGQKSLHQGHFSCFQVFSKKTIASSTEGVTRRDELRKLTPCAPKRPHSFEPLLVPSRPKKKYPQSSRSLRSSKPFDPSTSVRLHLFARDWVVWNTEPGPTDKYFAQIGGDSSAEMTPRQWSRLMEKTYAWSLLHSISTSPRSIKQEEEGRKSVKIFLSPHPIFFVN
jgi:hypothetical protein